MSVVEPDRESFMPVWGAYLYQHFLQSSPQEDSLGDWQDVLRQPSAQAEYLLGLPTAWPAAEVGQSPTVIKTDGLPITTDGLYQPSPRFSFSNSTGISTSLLTQSSDPMVSMPSQLNSTESINVVDGSLTCSPSPLSSHIVSPHASPVRLPKKSRGRRRLGSAVKRSHSQHSDSEFSHSHDDDHEPEVPEGVERDGMIWGMKVEEYRALPARERKRVRNRISARTFRAKRKEHLSALENELTEKDQRIRLAQEEMKKKLAKVQNAYPGSL
ncbi:hypothetical protein L204_100835 [Cryptococcus depauperatus]